MVIILNPEKVGKFIKKLRKDNNLTQQQLASKYGVTYQAVSKWENGINLPEITLIRQMSKDFNISVEEILDGEILIKKKKRKRILLVELTSLIIIILIGGIIIGIDKTNHKSFDFKTLSTTCKEFTVSGSMAYDKEKASIYISHITYCGGNDTNIYKNLECNLYEKNNTVSTKISSCKANSSNITLEEYLKDLKINIDNYVQTCKYYNNDSLYLEIEAIDQDDKIVTYKIPLKLNDNCSE